MITSEEIAMGDRFMGVLTASIILLIGWYEVWGQQPPPPPIPLSSDVIPMLIQIQSQLAEVIRLTEEDQHPAGDPRLAIHAQR
jgi:hypothetical protein